MNRFLALITGCFYKKYRNNKNNKNKIKDNHENIDAIIKQLGLEDKINKRISQATTNKVQSPEENNKEGETKGDKTQPDEVHSTGISWEKTDTHAVLGILKDEIDNICKVEQSNIKAIRNSLGLDKENKETEDNSKPIHKLIEELKIDIEQKHSEGYVSTKEPAQISPDKNDQPKENARFNKYTDVLRNIWNNIFKNKDLINSDLLVGISEYKDKEIIKQEAENLSESVKNILTDLRSKKNKLAEALDGNGTDGSKKTLYEYVDSAIKAIEKKEQEEKLSSNNNQKQTDTKTDTNDYISKDKIRKGNCDSDECNVLNEGLFNKLKTEIKDKDVAEELKADNIIEYIVGLINQSHKEEKEKADIEKELLENVRKQISNTAAADNELKKELNDIENLDKIDEIIKNLLSALVDKSRKITQEINKKNDEINNQKENIDDLNTKVEEKEKTIKEDGKAYFADYTNELQKAQDELNHAFDNYTGSPELKNLLDEQILENDYCGMNKFIDEFKSSNEAGAAEGVDAARKDIAGKLSGCYAGNNSSRATWIDCLCRLYSYTQVPFMAELMTKDGVDTQAVQKAFTTVENIFGRTGKTLVYPRLFADRLDSEKYDSQNLRDVDKYFPKDSIKDNVKDDDTIIDIQRLGIKDNASGGERRATVSAFSN